MKTCEKFSSVFGGNLTEQKNSPQQASILTSEMSIGGGISLFENSCPIFEFITG
jgi:hypothetical protein